MPAKSKKRRLAGKFYETTPNVKQVTFPARKRTIKDRTPLSAPSKYQQTITQMNPFFEMYHPDAENESLEYHDGEQEGYITSPVGRKRRKIIPEEATGHKIETRSARRQAIKVEQRSEEDDEEENDCKRQGRRILHESAIIKPSKTQSPAVLMPPPKTPRSRRRKEIPSSQSPADTPLSAQSFRSIRAYSRSPLKERSTNVIPTPSRKMESHWVKKLEVADSMETTEDESSVVSHVSSMISLSSRMTGPEDAEDAPRAVLQLPNMAAPDITNIKEIPESSQRMSPLIEGGSYGYENRGVVDSDQDGDEGEDVGFDAGLETEATLASLDPSLPNSNQRHAFGLLSSELVEFQPDNLDTQASSPNGSIARISCKDQVPALTPEMMEDGRIGRVAALSSNTPFPRKEQHRYLDGASAQLHEDLQRAIQTGALETESQFEGAWNTYHSGKTIDPASDPSNMLSSPECADQKPSEHMTVPTQLLTPRLTTRSTPFKLPVPPSQATTVDITQPSPRKMPSSSHRLPTPFRIPSSSKAFTSSPPPLAPPTSSPTTTRKAADPWAGFEWNGVRLTDSQLLPESLMNDSQLGPLLTMTQESLDDEL